jgi:ribosome-associated protein
MKLTRKVALPSIQRANGEGTTRFEGRFSNEDQMDHEDTFWVGGEPALARRPNPAYTEGMIRVTGAIAIGEEEIHQEFIRASGPGGQNVNKVATAVQLRFDVAHSPSLPEDVRERLTRLAGKRMTKEGYLIIDARRFRTQEQNRQDSVARLVGLIRQAAQRPQIRKKTKPTLASKERRLESKHRRGKIKYLRRAQPE